MMSYGSTAETSFALVRTLVAQDPGLLERVDAVLGARGFAKLVTRDTPVAAHPRARAEAVRELRWLAEYLQSVYNRADKFAPQEKPARLAVVDDDDDEVGPAPNGPAPNGPAPNGPAPNGHSHASLSPQPAANGSGVGATAPLMGKNGSADQPERANEPSSEEYSGTSEEPEELAPQRATAAPSRSAETELPRPAEPMQTGLAPLPAATERDAARRPADADELARTRLLKRQRHMQEREQVRRAQERLRVERERERARGEQQRLLQNRLKLEQKRQRAAARTDAALDGVAQDDDAHDDDAHDGVELWCLCRRPAYGFMLACANPKCAYEWYHGGCVDQETAPKARWFCPLCRPSYALGPPARAAAARWEPKRELPFATRSSATRSSATRSSATPTAFRDARRAEDRPHTRTRATRAARAAEPVNNPLSRGLKRAAASTSAAPPRRARRRA